MTENKRFEYNVNKNSIEYCEKHFAYCNGQQGKIANKLNELHEENQRLTDKLNKTALELVDECISQGKAVEISEMSYSEFLDYRAKNGKPMELQL